MRKIPSARGRGAKTKGRGFKGLAVQRVNEVDFCWRKKQGKSVKGGRRAPTFAFNHPPAGGKTAKAMQSRMVLAV
jgi:hypothetical protein